MTSHNCVPQSTLHTRARVPPAAAPFIFGVVDVVLHGDNDRGTSRAHHMDERGALASILRLCAVTCVLMEIECWLLCAVRRMFGSRVCHVVRWLLGCGLVGLLVVWIVPLFLSFLAIPGLCCFFHVTHDLLQEL